MKPNRKRPVLHTTVGDYTLAVLAQVAKDIAMPNYGVTVDYIVNDWVEMKKRAIQTAAPAEAEAVPA
jgi:hypothetical protein